MVIAYDLDEGLFAAHFPYFQEHQSFESMFNENRIRKKLNAITGRKLGDVKLTVLLGEELEVLHHCRHRPELLKTVANTSPEILALSKL